MSPTDTARRTETSLTERLKRHFGDRLQNVLELPGAPYEDRDEGRFFAVVLTDEEYDRDRARREALEVQNQFDLDTGYRDVTTVYVLSTSELKTEETRVATLARTKGISA